MEPLPTPEAAHLQMPPQRQHGLHQGAGAHSCQLQAATARERISGSVNTNDESRTRPPWVIKAIGRVLYRRKRCKLTAETEVRRLRHFIKKREYSLAPRKIWARLPKVLKLMPKVLKLLGEALFQGEMGVSQCRIAYFRRSPGDTRLALASLAWSICFLGG